MIKYRKAVLAPLLVIPLFALIALFAFSELTIAGNGDDVWCPAVYAPTAVGQNQQNLDNKCGYTGPRWSSDKDAHARWCMKDKSGLAQREIDARISELQKCGVTYPAGADKWCNIYSIIAIAQNTANTASSCNLTGPAWKSDYIYHHAWCEKVPREATDSETTKRMTALGNCVPATP
jgi:hypothetical protein